MREKDTQTDTQTDRQANGEEEKEEEKENEYVNSFNVIASTGSKHNMMRYFIMEKLC